MIKTASRLVLATILACAPATQTPGQLGTPAPAQALVQVDPAEIMVLFPAVVRPDSAWPAQQLRNRYSGPEWRILIRVDSQWLAAVHHFEPDSAPLPAFASLGAALRAGRLRSCTLDAWLLVCARSLHGATSLVEGRVQIRIQDAEWRRRLGARRPARALLSVVRNGQEAFWSDTVRIDYTGVERRGGA